MDAEQLVIFLIVGGVAGWLAGLIMKGGLGLVGNIVVGVIGAFIGGWLFGLLDISIGGKWIGPIVTALVGSLILLFAVGFIKKK